MGAGCQAFVRRVGVPDDARLHVTPGRSGRTHAEGGVRGAPVGGDMC